MTTIRFVYSSETSVRQSIPQFHRDHGIDTLFFRESSAKSCGKDTAGHDIAGKLAIQYDFYCLVSTDIPLVKLKNNSHVLAQLISDEGDNKAS